MHAMIKVLFVCLGNICRSPLAEAIFNNIVRERGLEEKLSADSAGTSNYHVNEQPDERTFEVAEKNGLILNHLGRQIHKSDFEKFDYILAMDSANYAEIMAFRKRHSSALSEKPKIIKLRKFEDANADLNVPDPYFGGRKGFDQVYDIMYLSINNFLDFVVEKHRL
jgi:protein-tyrosine phosphatase